MFRNLGINGWFARFNGLYDSIKTIFYVTYIEVEYKYKKAALWSLIFDS